MLRSLLKLGMWLVIGAGTITAIVGNTDFKTPWQYTVHSTIAPGTQFTLTQPNGESVHIKVEEGQVITGQKTFDIGAPITLAFIFALGGITAFGLKSKHHRHDNMG